MRRMILILVSFLLAGCAYGDNAAVGGRIVLWHSATGTVGSVLDDIVDRFMEINPHIQVSLVSIPADEMLSRYRNAAELSLGPDLFIGETTWIPALADQDLIQSLDRYDPSLDGYFSAAVENIHYDGEVYGIPYGLTLNALFYNADRVTTPPDTLAALLAQATDGNGTAMTTRFDHAFWGVRAFGGRMFGDDGRVTLDGGGFASWLSWMSSAQNAVGMFLNNDRATLMNLFMSGQVAYYVGTPDDFPLLSSNMEANIGVAPLPTGPGGPAGPLLHLDALMFNRASAQRNTRAALELARFLTNDENSLRLAREVGHVPANSRVPGIDARTYPIVNGFMTQARTAIPIVNTEAMSVLLADGDRLYRRVLDGVVDATEGAASFTATINTALGYEQVEPQTVLCTESGNMRLWHSWQDQDERVLQRIIDRFEAHCTAVDVIVTQFGSESELVSNYGGLYDPDLKPDVLLLSDTWVYELASEGMIQPIESDLLQQFVPATLNALAYQNSVYGTPVSLWLTVLFYDVARVSDPPRTLDDLVTDAAEAQPVAIASSFETAFWGISAFGGTLFGPDMALAVNQDGAMVAWLDWLRSMRSSAGFIVDTELDLLADLFSDGTAMYLIGPSHLLQRFDPDRVAITALPAGPAGEASSILRTDAFMVNASVEDERLALIQAFVNTATSMDNQQLMFELTRRFPANINVPSESDVMLTALQSQLNRATVLPNVEEIAPVLLSGDRVYDAVLNDEADIETAVSNFVATVNDLNEVQPTPPVETTVDATPEITVSP